MPKHMIFVRHGESMANAGFRTVDYKGTQLTVFGQQQAGEVPGRLQGDYPWFTPDAIYSSHYERALQTAQPSWERWPDAAPHVLQELCEFDYLHFAGLSTSADERAEKRNAYWQRCDPDYRDSDQTESYSSFYNRVLTALELLQQSPYSCILVFTHGNFMRQLILAVSPPDPQLTDRTNSSDYMKQEMARFRDSPLPSLENCHMFHLELQ